MRIIRLARNKTFLYLLNVPNDITYDATNPTRIPLVNTGYQTSFSSILDELGTTDWKFVYSIGVTWLTEPPISELSL